MFLKPHRKVDLEHRALLLRGTPTGSIVVGGMDDSRLTLIGSDFATLQSIELTSTVEAASLHPLKPFLAWVDKKSGLLKVQKLDGEPIAEIVPPRLAPGTSTWGSPMFHDCFFDDSGNFLWLVAPLGDKEVEVQLHHTSDWSLVANRQFEDQQYESSRSFHRAGQPGLASLWLNAGQDGQEVYWLSCSDRELSCQREPMLSNTAPPAFSPDGSHFVAVHDDGTMQCYEFLTMREIGTGVQSPLPDNPFTESYCYLDNRYGLAGTNDYRVFLIDTNRAQIEEEIAVEGHEPRPVGEYYPRLANEPGLCTDLAWFTRIGDVVVFVYQRDGGPDFRAWKDSLLLYRVAA